MSSATYTGAAALQALLGRLTEVSDESPDYLLMSKIVAASIEANLHHADEMHRQGYLRALTDLLSMTADGCEPPDDWNPIKTTEAAFAAPAAAAAMIRRAAG